MAPGLSEQSWLCGFFLEFKSFLGAEGKKKVKICNFVLNASEPWESFKISNVAYS